MLAVPSPVRLAIQSGAEARTPKYFGSDASIASDWHYPIYTGAHSYLRFLIRRRVRPGHRRSVVQSIQPPLVGGEKSEVRSQRSEE